MPPLAPHLERFLKRVHRRLLALRLLESAALGMLGGAAVALVLVSVLLWKGQPAMNLAAGVLALGAAVGLVAAALRPPPITQAAQEADRQLDLHDLLTTAWGLRTLHADHPADDAFARAVFADADAKCAGVSPSQVVLNRFGARAWGGIGLAAALVLAMGALSADPEATRASSLKSTPEPPKSGLTTITAPNAATSSSSSARNRPLVNDDPEDDSHRGGNADQAKTVGARASDSPENPRSSDGGGAGQARTATHSAHEGSGLLQGTDAHRHDPSGESAAGAGAALKPRGNSAGGPGASSASTPAPPGSIRSPAWTNSTWPAARERAQDALRSNQVPAEYHELLRAYFDR